MAAKALVTTQYKQGEVRVTLGQNREPRQTT